MDLSNANRVQMHEFCKKVKIEKIFIFQTTVLKYGDLLGHGSCEPGRTFCNQIEFKL